MSSNRRVVGLRGRVIGTAVAVLVLRGVAMGQAILFVDAKASPGQDGSSWAAAYSSLQDALDAASAGTQIRVAGGSYLPTLQTSATDPRTATFALVSGVTLRGGYAGAAASDPDARDPLLYPSVLTGDIGVPGSPSDNALHVVTARGTDATAVLDGFTITAGRADGFGPLQDRAGGGLLSVTSDPSVRDCTFTGNFATILGGGAWNHGGGPGFEGCSFTGNSVSIAGGGGLATTGGHVLLTECAFSSCTSGTGLGGAISGDGSDLTLVHCSVSNSSTTAMQIDGGSLELRDCTLSGNGGIAGGAVRVVGGLCTAEGCLFTDNLVAGRSASGGTGGALSLLDTTATLIGCRFHGNTALGGVVDGGRGGALHVEGGAVLVANSVFTGNAVGSAIITARDGGRGGAICVEPSGVLVVAGCSLAGNHADTQAGGLSGSVVGGVEGVATIRNSILSGNTDITGAGEGAQVASSATLQSCCVDGWSGALGGTGNFSGPPLFADADGPDNVVGTVDDDLHLLPGSPCIDAGDNALVPQDELDLDGDGIHDAPLPLDLDATGRFADDTAVADTGGGPAPVVDMGAFERSAWSNLGHALAGVAGEPLLVGTGSLVEGEVVSVRLTRARPGAAAWMVVGATALNAPFRGGVLVPDPFPPGFAIVLATDGIGSATVSAIWPPSAEGVALVFQEWILDPAGAMGCSASNGVSSLSP